MGNRQLRQSLLYQFAIRTPQQDALGSFRGCGQGFLHTLIERHSRRDLQSGARGEKCISQNLVDPGAKIRTRLKRGESPKRFGIRLLHEILGFLPVLRQPAGEVIEPIKVRHGQLLERLLWQVRFRHAHKGKPADGGFIPIPDK